MAFETPAPQENSPEVFKGLSWKELQNLPPETRDSLTKETAKEFLDFFRSNATEFSSVTKLYLSLKGEELVVRREAPGKIVESIRNETPIHVGFPEGQRYSNAVEWRSWDGTLGLQNAYLEGYGHANGVVAVCGVRRSAVSDMVKLEDATAQFAGVERSRVRSIRGDIYPSDIIFVSLRVPAGSFPISDMTTVERDNYHEWLEDRTSGVAKKPMFIHRGFLFNDHIQKH